MEQVRNADDQTAERREGEDQLPIPTERRVRKRRSSGGARAVEIDLLVEFGMREVETSLRLDALKGGPIREGRIKKRRVAGEARVVERRDTDERGLTEVHRPAELRTPEAATLVKREAV